MIPGPTEYYPQVLAKLGEPALSHVSPVFIEEFGSAIEVRMRCVVTCACVMARQHHMVYGSVFM